MKKHWYLLWLVGMMLCMPLFSTHSFAESLRLHEAFSSHMVLPKDKPLHVFGKGEGKVKVSLAGKSAKAKAVDGQWMAELPPMKAGGPYRLTVQSKDGRVEVEDVWIGTVVVAAGQSNMQFKLKESSTPPSEWESDPLMRSFSVSRIEKGEPHTPEEGWVLCTKEDAGNWSAIGYHIAKALREKTGEAVGIINCYQGASIIEAWMPEEISQEERFLLPKEEKHFDHFYPAYAAFNKHGILFETMVKTIAPYSVSHVAWYQGESNTGKGEYRIYPQLAKCMVESWRTVFQDEELPFTMVQIANLKGRGDEVGWKNIQQAQMRIPYVVKGVKVVRSADVCEDNNIHPKSKEALARRIADTIE